MKTEDVVKKINHLYDNFCCMVRNCLQIYPTAAPNLFLNQQGKWIVLPEQPTSKNVYLITDVGNNTSTYYNPILAQTGVTVLLVIIDGIVRVLGVDYLFNNGTLTFGSPVMSSQSLLVLYSL